MPDMKFVHGGMRTVRPWQRSAGRSVRIAGSGREHHDDEWTGSLLSMHEAEPGGRSIGYFWTPRPDRL